jgi:hypothetical protein
VVVDIHRDAGLGVAEPLAHDLDVGAHLEEQGGLVWRWSWMRRRGTPARATQRS